MELDLTERQLLNQIQSGVPLTGRPFRDLGLQSGLDEDEVIRRVLYLKECGVLRWVGAIIDWGKLGFQSTLVAMRLPSECLESAAQIINRQQGVIHSYERNHDYNLWFTLTVSPTTQLNDVISELARQVGAKGTLNLPVNRVFKMHPFFDMLGENGGQQLAMASMECQESPGAECPQKPTVVEIGILKELQNDLPIKRRPFDQMARRVDIYLDEFLAKAQELIRRGIICRYSGVLHHQKAGYSYNAMLCWKVPRSAVETVGSKIVSFPATTYCYERAVNCSWPYNVFAMIHGHSKDECERIAKEISREVGISDYILLYGTKEFKQEMAVWLG
jgi:DNA-binding Lrp family transcriptional regulator